MGDPDPESLSASHVHRFLPGEEELVLLLLHGTGGDENDLLPLGRALRPGAALLSPRGNVLEQGMARFFRRLAPGVFDQQDLVRRTQELADFLEEASSHYGFDPRRVVAVGLSNGANIAASLLLLRPGALAGAVLFRPMVPLEPPALPDLSAVPLLLAAGRHDHMVPPGESERLAGLLRAAGAEVELLWVEAGHGLTREEVTHAAAWLERRKQRLLDSSSDLPSA